MDLTPSYDLVVPDHLLDRYVWYETRNASAIISSTNEKAWDHLLQVLDWFELTTDDLISPGGGQTELAMRINTEFRNKGWREARVDTEIELVLALMKWGASSAQVRKTRTKNRGFKVDNFMGRIALDVEWNAKDGNLSRDLAAYRALYEYGLIDAAAIITRTFPDTRQLAYQLAKQAGLSEDQAKSRLGTTTTTNLDKLLPMLARGDAGGCPLLAVGICHKTWTGTARVSITEPTVSPRAWKEAADADIQIPAGGVNLA